MFLLNQRWISEAEPELGLGIILKVTIREIHIYFGAVQVNRVYSPESAPLKRVTFKVGDKILDKEGNKLKVTAVEENNGLYVYQCGKKSLSEDELADNLSFSDPQTRLVKQLLDDNETFNLRYETLIHKNRLTASPVYGYTGARVDLIPHQLYVASQVTQRKNPRVLLADEVGLGKTIEAGLILHRKLMTGAVTRVLIIVPESLVHQWFVEIFRKFNIWLTIMDEERCLAITHRRKKANPFLDSQLIIASQELLLNKPEWGIQAVKGEWDLTIIDEAHHIVWNPEQTTPEYELAAQICQASKAVLLLTATPEQLGEESHFARLKLLAPERFFDFKEFQKENKSQKAVAELASVLFDHKDLTDKQLKSLKQILKDEPDLDKWLKNIPGNSDKIVDALVDRHGPGRLIFRNTRKVMKNFPPRKFHPYPLELPEFLQRTKDAEKLPAIEAYLEEIDNQSIAHGLKKDPRMKWLVDFITKNKEKKFLFICKTKEKAIAVEECFRQFSGLKTVLFHEDLNLMQRDKNAVYFAAPDGAMVMFCSEIGSEGRNFQFAHDLILWDIPTVLGLLEQRIGRLDRIGQTEVIKIHCPFFLGTAQEILLKIYHEGMDAFEHSLQSGNYLLDKFQEQILALIQSDSASAKELKELTEKIKKTTNELRHRLEEGRDRLLEYNSFRPHEAKKIIDAISSNEATHLLEKYLENAFEHFGILHEEMSPGIWKIAPGPNMLSDALPALLPDGQLMSLKRQKALHDEQMMFLSWEHPLVLGMIDELLSGEKGNAAFGLYEEPNSRSLLLETIYVAEALASADLQIERYFPTTPLRFVINHKLENLTDSLTWEDFLNKVTNGEPHKVLNVEQVTDGFIPAMLEKAKTLAESAKTKLINNALKKAEEGENFTIERLKALAKVNPSVSEEDIKAVENQKVKIESTIKNIQLRLDAVRFVWKGSKSYFG